MPPNGFGRGYLPLLNVPGKRRISIVSALARIDVPNRVFQLADPTPELTADQRHPLRAEQQQEDEAEHDQLPVTRHAVNIDAADRPKG